MGHDLSITTPPHPSSGRESRLRRIRMTASDRADDGTDADRPSVFLYRGLMATSHRSVHPRAPVRGKYTPRTTRAAHDRPCAHADARGPRGRSRAATDRPTDRCPRSRMPTTTRRRVGIERRARGDARERDEEDVRARSRDDRRGRSRGGVGRRRENDGIGASETDATRCDATTARDDRRACAGG